MIGIEVSIIGVIKEAFRTETGHMTKVKVGMEILEENLIGIEKTVHLGIVLDPPLGIKVKREGVIIVENQDIL